MTQAGEESISENSSTRPPHETIVLLAGQNDRSSGRDGSGFGWYDLCSSLRHGVARAPEPTLTLDSRHGEHPNSLSRSTPDTRRELGGFAVAVAGKLVAASKPGAVDLASSGGSGEGFEVFLSLLECPATALVATPRSRRRVPLPEDIGSFEVVRVEPGRAIVWNDEKFIEVVDGLASELERPTDVSISSLAWSPELGLVIGDGFGSVWVDDRAGEWRVLGSDNTRYWTPIVRSVPGGVLFQTGGGGPIRALDIESGLCPDGPALPGAPLALEPFGDGFLAVPRGFRTGTPRSSALLTVEPHCSDS